MDLKKLRWEYIHLLDDYFITYLIYKEGKSLDTISLIRNKSKEEIEKDIIKSKIKINQEKSRKEDLLIKVISMNKKERVEFLETLDEDLKNKLVQQIYRRYIKFKNSDDRMILIWLIGELKDKRLLPFLRMELRSNNVNFKRLSCSALGKIRNKETKPWIEDMVYDDNPQVRQYAIKALYYIGDEKTEKILKKVLKDKKEKEYVKRAATNTINKLKNN